MSNSGAPSSGSLIRFFQRRGIYYGYPVLFAGTVGVIMSVPGQTMGISVYTEALSHSLGVTRTGLSMAYMFGTLGSALLLPFVGRLLDSLGSRVVGVLASFGLALWLLLLSHGPVFAMTISHWTHASAAQAGGLVAFLGFLGIRHFGQGELTIASRTMMGRWFERRRGLMLGISGLFVAFGFGVAPLVLHRLILRYSWQHSLWILSGAAAATGVFAWITFRKSPESCGLILDGRLPDSGNATAAVAQEPCYTAQQAKRTFVFWAFNIGMAAQAMLFTAIIFHMQRIAELNHMTAARAFSVFLPVAVVSTAADLLGGAASDRIPLKYLLTAMQLGICFGLIGVHYYHTDTGYALTAIGFGMGNGLFSLLTGTAWPKLFGREHLGAIAGANMSWIVAGSALGPYIFSLGASATGSYQAILLFSLVLPFTVLVGSFFAEAPPRIPAPRGTESARP